jgi:hypothetical protein
VSEPVSGLAPGTTYHYRLCAQDQEPDVGAFCSHDETFTTIATEDSVTGSGSVPALGDVNFTVSVHGGPSGENPSGSWHVTSTSISSFNFDATPTCLNVSGSEGTTGFRIDTGPQTGTGFMAAFRDGGAGADQGLWYLFSTDPSAQCPSPASPPAGSVIGPTSISGDVKVVDAPPPAER